MDNRKLPCFGFAELSASRMHAAWRPSIAPTTRNPHREAHSACPWLTQHDAINPGNAGFVSGLSQVDALRCKKWLGWQDSNLRMPIPKTGALPLGHTPAGGERIAAAAGFEKPVFVVSQPLITAKRVRGIGTVRSCWKSARRLISDGAGRCRILNPVSSPSHADPAQCRAGSQRGGL